VLPFDDQLQHCVLPTYRDDLALLPTDLHLLHAHLLCVALLPFDDQLQHCVLPTYRDDLALLPTDRIGPLDFMLSNPLNNVDLKASAVLPDPAAILEAWGLVRGVEHRAQTLWTVPLFATNPIRDRSSRGLIGHSDAGYPQAYSGGAGTRQGRANAGWRDLRQHDRTIQPRQRLSGVLATKPAPIDGSACGRGVWAEPNACPRMLSLNVASGYPILAPVR